jgi:hypothetical protein
VIRLVWLVFGFCAGVVVSRNAAAMSQPEQAAVFFMVVLSAAVCWWAGYRGKASAVATAVATAVAVAKSEANAHAQALAMNAVQVNVGDGWDHRPGSRRMIGQLVRDDDEDQDEEVEEAARFDVGRTSHRSGLWLPNVRP